MAGVMRSIFVFGYAAGGDAFDFLDHVRLNEVAPVRHRRGHPAHLEHGGEVLPLSDDVVEHQPLCPLSLAVLPVVVVAVRDEPRSPRSGTRSPFASPVRIRGVASANTFTLRISPTSKKYESHGLHEPVVELHGAVPFGLPALEHPVAEAVRSVAERRAPRRD